LNDITDQHVGNPNYHAVSPDKQLRINGICPGQEGLIYWLEKWNPAKKKYEFISNFSDEVLYERLKENSVFYYSKGWFWVSNSKVLFKCWGYGRYYEMEFIATAPTPSVRKEQ